MKRLPLTAFVWLFNLTFYLFVLFAAVFVVVEAVRWFNADYTASYSFGSINPKELELFDVQKFNLNSSKSGIQNPHIVTENWKITFDAKATSVKLFMSVITLLQVLYVLAILIVLRSFVMSLKNNEAFTLQNIKRLQVLGVLLLLIEPLTWVTRYVRRQWLIGNLDIQFTDLSNAYRIGYSLGAREFVWNWILAGLLVLVIAGVFKQGVRLKEEVDLTV